MKSFISLNGVEKNITIASVLIESYKLSNSSISKPGIFFMAEYYRWIKEAKSHKDYIYLYDDFEDSHIKIYENYLEYDKDFTDPENYSAILRFKEIQMIERGEWIL